MTRLRHRVVVRRGWRRRVLAIGFGVVAAAALPPLHAVPLLIVGFSGLFWLLEDRRQWRAAFATGWWFGVGHFTAGLYWVSASMLVDPERFAWMIPFAVFGLAAGLAVFPAMATLVTAWSRTRGVGGVLILAAAWTAGEWLRGWVFTGFPWNLMGTVWVFSDGMIQLVSLTGVWGLSLLTVMAAAMPAVLAGGAAPRRGPMVAVALAFALLAAVWGGGLARLAGASDEVVANVSLRLVQANIAQELKWRPDMRQRHFSRQLEMSAGPAARGPTHVIWGETAATFFLEGDVIRRAMIGAVTPPGGLTIVGAPRKVLTANSPRVFNSVHAIDSAGRVVGTYDKFHLVPFGEYVPFRRFLPLTKMTVGRADFSPGPGVRTLHLPGLPPVSPLICYEVIFPGQVARRGARPAWLLNITNDAWFGATAGPYQHLAAARLRAVEEGLPLVRVANTGISAVIDAHGRVQASLGLGRAGVLDSALPVPLDGITLYVLYGELVLWFLLALVIGMAYLAPAESLREER